MAVEHISKGNDDGTTFGQDTADLISFYGVDPVDQPAAVTTVDVTTITAVQVATATTTHLIAAANLLITDSQAQATAINTIISRLQEVGLLA